jgi:hypothetical protein
MDQDKLIDYESDNSSELQERYIKEKNLEQDYWEFVEEEFNNSFADIPDDREER